MNEALQWYPDVDLPGGLGRAQQKVTLGKCNADNAETLTTLKHALVKRFGTAPLNVKSYTGRVIRSHVLLPKRRRRRKRKRKYGLKNILC